jgi:pimeloyl-ACP methyl ester carboxylesterase
MSVSTELGPVRQVSLPHGLVRYRERGSGDALVFVHGVFCNGDLWRKVVPLLASDYRCITPDWPLGAHFPALSPDADLTPPGVAQLIVDFCESVGAIEPTLVGNDTGGAFVQLVAAGHAARVGRVVLTSCDAFSNFPPALLRPAALLARRPRLMFLLGQTLRPRAIQRLLYRWSTKRPLPDSICQSYSRHGLRRPDVVRDLARVLRSLEPRHTLSAAERMRGFERPVLVVWAGDDRFFPPSDGQRLADLVPDGRFELVEDSYTFIPEDQPVRLASLIHEFLGETPIEREDAIARAG